MERCPDCDSIEINPLDNKGDGICDKCHGTGEGTFGDRFAATFVDEDSKCYKCSGTGQCQTCGGTGVVYD